MAGVSGPILFGYCLDVFLYGILTVQVYLYYLAFPNDRGMTKTIVYFIYIIGTLQIALGLYDFYMLFCTEEGAPYLQLKVPYLNIRGFGFMRFVIPIDGVLVTSVVQFFYAHRIYTISKARAITGIVSLLTLIQLLCGGISAGVAFKPSGLTALDNDLTFGDSNLFVGGVMGGICDLLIAVYMAYYLLRQMKGASRTTQAFVTKIVRLLLETGIAMCGMAVAYASLSFFLARGLSWFMIPGLSLGKLYANSMLVLLNNRFVITGGRNTLHPDFDIPSYHRSEVAGANTGQAVSRGITFTRGHQAEAAFSGGAVHAIGLGSRSRPVGEEPEEGGRKGAGVAGVGSFKTESLS